MSSPPIVLRRVLVALAAALALPSAVRAADEPAGRKYALLVGVSEYKASAELRALPGAEHDVTHLRQVLVDGGFKATDITLLTCRGAAKPTGESIRAALKSLAEKCKPEDTVVLAFAGHGIQLKDAQQSFCPYDAVWDKPDTLIPLLTVFEEVGRCPAKRKLLLVDACRVDPRAETEGTDEAAGKRSLNVSGTITVPPGNDLVALFSCKQGQVAYEDARLRHGVFFHYTILGLAGEAADKDGTVTLDALVSYVRQNTVRHVKTEFDADQEPRMFQNGETGVFPIVQITAADEVKALMRQAKLAAGKGDTEAAREAYTKAIALDKKNADAYYQRGVLLKAEGRELKSDKVKQAAKYDEAADDFDRALRLKPDHLEAYLARADVNYQQASYKAALRDYKAALELDDAGAEVLAARSLVHFWDENTDGAMTAALTDAERAVKLNPDYPRGYYARGLARMGSGEKQMDAALYQEGMADIDRAIAMEPNNFEFRNYRLQLLVEQGNAERVAQEQARYEQVAANVARSDLSTQYSVVRQQATLGDFYHTNGYDEQADRTFRRVNDQAQTVGNGLKRPNQQNQWQNNLNSLQNRPGQPANNNPPPKIDPAAAAAAGQFIGALLAPKLRPELSNTNPNKPVNPFLPPPKSGNPGVMNPLPKNNNINLNPLFPAPKTNPLFPAPKTNPLFPAPKTNPLPAVTPKINPPAPLPKINLPTPKVNPPAPLPKINPPAPKINPPTPKKGK